MQPILNIILATPLGGTQFANEHPIITSISHWLGPLLLFLFLAVIPCGPMHYANIGILAYFQLVVVGGITYLVWIILSRRKIRLKIRLALTCLGYVVSCIATNVLLLVVEMMHR